MEDKIVLPYYMAQFKEALQKEDKSLRTILSYLRTVQDFNEINCEANKEFNIRELKQENIKRYVETMKDNGCSLATIRTRLSALGSFLLFLHRLKALKNEPDKLLDFPLDVNDRSAAVTTEDIKKLREAFERGGNKRDLLIFELLLNTGIKVSELCGIDITKDIDLELELLTVRKGYDHRIIPLNPRAKGALIDYIKERGTKPDNNLIYGPLGPMKRTAIFKVLRKYATRAGIQGMNPNALRELFEQLLLEKGLPRPQVGYLLGITKYNVGVTINGEDLERMKKVLEELYREGE